MICPGGTEHIGVFTEPNVVPERWKDHAHGFHNPIVFVPRLNGAEMRQVAESICDRLQHTQGNAVMMLPLQGTSRYGVEGGQLRDTESDAEFYQALRENIPPTIDLQEFDCGPEDKELIDAAVDRLLAML